MRRGNHGALHKVLGLPCSESYKRANPDLFFPDDFESFERVLEEAVTRTGIRLLSFCVMGSHWHLVVWPEVDGPLSKFVGWLT